jgi:hypothetical protein
MVLPPIPERSNIPGVPKDPAHSTTSFVPRTVRVSVGPSGWNSGLNVNATPVARLSLPEIEKKKKKERKGNRLNVLVEYDVLHMYASENVEVRTCLFEGVDHMVRHVGANASLSVYPPARKA